MRLKKIELFSKKPMAIFVLLEGYGSSVVVEDFVITTNDYLCKQWHQQGKGSSQLQCDMECLLLNKCYIVNQLLCVCSIYHICLSNFLFDGK